jgi:hypothetical protein
MPWSYEGGHHECLSCGAGRDDDHELDCVAAEDVRRPVESLFDDYWKLQDKDSR